MWIEEYKIKKEVSSSGDILLRGYWKGSRVRDWKMIREGGGGLGKSSVINGKGSFKDGVDSSVKCYSEVRLD